MQPTAALISQHPAIESLFGNVAAWSLATLNAALAQGLDLRCVLVTYRSDLRGAFLDSDQRAALASLERAAHCHGVDLAISQNVD